MSSLDVTIPKYRLHDLATKEVKTPARMFFGDDGSGDTISIICAEDFDGGIVKKQYVLIETALLARSTGLLDIEGNEIYEYDIVECGYGKGYVNFRAGCFFVDWMDDEGELMDVHSEFLFSRKGTYRREGEDVFKIIGNLLK